MSFEVTQGETFEFEYSLTNVGEDAATQDIVLLVDGTEEDRDSDVSVGNNGGRASGTLTYDSTNVDLGSYSVSVESGDDTASDTIEVVAAGNFTLSITSTNSPVTEGSDLDVNVDVTNTGKETDGQTIELVIGGNLRATKYVEVDSGNTKSITLTWATSDGDAGDYTATVNSLDDTATASVDVEDAIAVNGDGTQFFSNDSNELDTTQYSGSVAFDLAEMAADDTVNTTGGGDIQFRPDGNVLFLMDKNGSDVEKIELGTAFDITTIQTTTNQASLSNDVEGFCFKGDGTKFYKAEDDNNRIVEYDLSTKWDVSTRTQTASESISGQIFGITFKDDGAKVYYPEVNNDEIREYSLSTPWDLSSIGTSYNAVSLNETPTDVVFSDDGSRFVVGGALDNWGEYSLGTAWDLSSSASKRTSFSSGQSCVCWDKEPFY